MPALALGVVSCLLPLLSGPAAAGLRPDSAWDALSQSAPTGAPSADVGPARPIGVVRWGLLDSRGAPLAASGDKDIPEPTVTPGEWYFGWAQCGGGEPGMTYSICFSTKVAETPGHAHASGLPEMKVYDPLCRENLPVNQSVYWRWRAPAFASRLTFIMSFSGACQWDVPSRAASRIPDMAELKPGPGYQLEPATFPHPYNHFGTTTTLKAIPLIAAEYQAEFPGDPALLVGDISLPWGGLFDEKGDWAPPHPTHRLGYEADIRRGTVPDAHRARLEQIFESHGARISTEGAYYHLDFTPHPLAAARRASTAR